MEKAVHRAARRLRLLEYAWFFLERELTSTVRVPWYFRPWLWRHGFLGESWVLYDLGHNPRNEYLPDYHRLVRTRLVNGRYAAILDDKLVFDRFLCGFAHLLPATFGILWHGRAYRLDRGPCTLRTRDWLDLILRERGALVLRPPSENDGQRFTLLKSGPRGPTVNGIAVGATGLVRLLEECDGYVVCEHVAQHPDIAHLYPLTTNTLRVLTLQDEDCDAFVAAAVLRIGTAASDPADSWTGGGLSAPVEVQTGRVGLAATYPVHSGRIVWHESHPDSGAPIEGLRIPHWGRLVRELLEVVRGVPMFRHVGWDLVVTAEGFRILAGSNCSDINLLQIHGPLLSDARVAAFYRRHGVLRP